MCVFACVSVRVPLSEACWTPVHLFSVSAGTSTGAHTREGGGPTQQSFCFHPPSAPLACHIFCRRREEVNRRDCNQVVLFLHLLLRCFPFILHRVLRGVGRLLPLGRHLTYFEVSYSICPPTHMTPSPHECIYIICVHFEACIIHLPRGFCSFSAYLQTKLVSRRLPRVDLVFRMHNCFPLHSLLYSLFLSLPLFGE